MKESLITVIVPSYNVEKYIKKCLESIINQTYQNLEIIVVNDGSSDDTLETIENITKLDKRINIINQENKGLSAARNIGIKKATGEYIILVDGDDSVEKNFIASLVEGVKKENSDIAVCGFNTVWKERTICEHSINKTISGEEAAIQLLTRQENLDIVAWNKIYRRSIFVDNGILYPEGEIHEDNLTTYKIYAKARKVSYIKDPLYNYYKRTNSITMSTKLEKSLKYKLRAAKEAQAYFVKNKKLKDAAEIAEFLTYYSFIDAMLAKKIPYEEAHFKWIKENKERLLQNQFLTKKLKIYLLMTDTKKSLPYKIFRKITL